MVPNNSEPSEKVLKGLRGFNKGGEIMAIGKVKVWYMTEEERQEYIKKYPIRPTKKANRMDFVDYEWRSEKAAESRRIAKHEKEGIL
jgi:peptide methionine sulfoxide reductase MsrA